MVSVPFNVPDVNRQVSKTARLRTKNRFFESNPSLSTGGAKLLTRPAAKVLSASVGAGPIRGIYSAPGTFSEQAFIVSNTSLYKLETDETVTLIGAVNPSGTGAATMAATQNIGTVPEHLWIADGALWLYVENGYAVGTLTVSANPANNDVVEIDGVYYKFTTGSVDTGSPAGTSGNPWLVLVGSTATDSVQNLADAIENTGEVGVQYSTALTAHDTAQTANWGTNFLAVRYRTAGTVGNSASTTETGANLSWGAATLGNGGSESLTEVRMPDDVGAISVAHINSYIIVVPAQGQGVNGRFYWIEPGEVTVHPLNYATAERSPDAILQCIVFGDMVWFLGQDTSEPWVASGNLDAPFRRYPGVLFDRGAWEGSAVQVKDSLILVDGDGAVFQIGKGGLKRISPPDIEERIRLAIQRQG